MPSSDLTFEDIKPVIDKYDSTIKAYKQTKRIIGRGVYQWFRSALENLFAGKSNTKLGLIMLFVAIGLPIRAYSWYPVITVVIVISCLISFMGFWLYAKKRFYNFKEDLIQALFQDNDIAVHIKRKDHIPKHHFNSTQLFDKAYLLSGEDCVEGTTSDFHFIFSELLAQGKLSWYGFDDIFEGLYFYGTWNESPFRTDFRLKQRNFLEPFDVTTTLQFGRYFMVLDSNGDEIKDKSIVNNLPHEFKKNLLALVKKHKCKLEIVYQDGQILILLHGKRDYFPLDFEDEISDKAVFTNIAEDVLFFRDLITLLSEAKES